jgi:hypothetical protein
MSRPRLYSFVAAYIGVLSALAIIGYYLADEVGLVHHRAPLTQKFATDLAYYDLPRMMIGLNGNGEHGATHVRIDLSLEIAKKDVPILEGYQPRITDKVSDFLATISPDRMQEMQYMPWLHKEILKQVNASGSPAPVHDVILRQMLIM